MYYDILLDTATYYDCYHYHYHHHHHYYYYYYYYSFDRMSATCFQFALLSSGMVYGSIVSTSASFLPLHSDSPFSFSRDRGPQKGIATAKSHGGRTRGGCDKVEAE